MIALGLGNDHGIGIRIGPGNSLTNGLTNCLGNGLGYGRGTGLGNGLGYSVRNGHMITITQGIGNSVRKNTKQAHMS